MPGKRTTSSYAEIFSERAHRYHKAMLDQPRARYHEFENLTSFIDRRQCNKVLDVPSGGGYLKSYLGTDVHLTNIDFSHGFATQGQSNIRQTQNGKFPCADADFDHVLSLTGLHHLPDIPGFLRECRRVLKSGGKLIIGEVEKGSAVAAFLNEFVDTHNSMGHKGNFLDAGFTQLLEQLAYSQITCEIKQYPWIFDSTNTMADFCINLFGLDLASREIVLKGLEQYLGFNTHDGKALLNWSMIYFTAIVLKC